MVVGRIKWCGSMVCALAKAHCFLSCFWTAGTRIRVEHVLRKGTYRRFERYWANGLYAEEMFSKQNVLQANSLREMSKWWCMSAVPRVFCVMRYSFRMTQRLPVVETSTEKGLERSFSYLAVPSVSYISISVVRFSFPPNPPTETCFSERVAVEDRPNKETPLPNRGVSSNSDY